MKFVFSLISKFMDPSALSVHNEGYYTNAPCALN